MREDEIRVRIAEIDGKIDGLKRKLVEQQEVEYDPLPPALVTKTSYEETVPAKLKTKKVLTLDDLLSNITQATSYYDYAKQLEEGKASLEFYHAIRKKKSTHPRHFNEPEYADIRGKFDQLPQGMKEQLAREMDKLDKIARSSDFTPMVFHSTLDRALKKMDNPQEVVLVVRPPVEATIEEELKAEWLSEGVITKRFLDELQLKHPEADVGRELIDFYTKKKLSPRMVEAFPRPKRLKPKKRKVKKRRKK